MSKKYIYYKNKKYKYTIYTGTTESHKYTVYASNLSEAITEVLGIPLKTGGFRTYKKLPHRKGYPKDMSHYKVTGEPLTVLIRREISDLRWEKEITS